MTILSVVSSLRDYVLSFPSRIVVSVMVLICASVLSIAVLVLLVVAPFMIFFIRFERVEFASTLNLPLVFRPIPHKEA